LLCAAVIASDDENDAESVLPELSDDEDVENERQHRALVVLASCIAVMDCNCCAVSDKHRKGQVMSREGQCIAVRLCMPLQLMNENIVL